LNCNKKEAPEEALTNDGEDEIEKQFKVTQKITPEKEDYPDLNLKG